MFKVFANAWKVKDIRKKLMFIFLVLLIYRIGSKIPLPGIDLVQLDTYLHGNSGSITTLFSIIAGGGVGSIFAMGIAPYITSSIIMQLLTVAIPKLEQLQKEGEEGRKKINQYTRIVAVGLSMLQAGATVYGYRYTQIGSLFYHNEMFVYIVAVIAMMTGTIFIMWLGELLTEKGIGNGSSFIIFSNIIANLPQGVMSMYSLVDPNAENPVRGWITIILMLAVFAALIAFVVLIQDGERRIPVQYSRKTAGKQMYGSNSSFIPIKVNIAGVMSIIFAISLLQFPQQLLQFFRGNAALTKITQFLDVTSGWTGSVIYIVLIFMFTFFYTSFAVNPVEMAENMRKNGGFIPGIRPGKPTSEYIQKTVDRLSWIGAVFYCVVAMAPYLLQRFSGGTRMGFGGTTLLIVSGVALEFIKQLESQLLMRHYKGFLS